MTHYNISGEFKRARVILPSATKLRQGNVCTPICHSVHGGVSASVHAGIHPKGRHTPWADHSQVDTPPSQTPPSPLGRHPQVDTHPGQTPPLGRNPHPPGQTPSLGRHPLGRQHPRPSRPLGRHPSPQQIATAADGTHPTGMHSCLDLLLLIASCSMTGNLRLKI